MDKSFLIEVQNKLRIQELENFKKEVRTNIIKCLDDERKTNEKLDKRLYEVEMDMFRDIVKDSYSCLEYHSEMASKLCKSFWLYSSLMDIDKKLEDVNLRLVILKGREKKKI